MIKGLRFLSKDIHEMMKPYFGIVAHDHQPITDREMNLLTLVSDATFEKRIVGFERLLQHRREHPHNAIVLLSSHLSEADFLETAVHFRRNDCRLLIQGGDNLFIDQFDLSTPFMRLSLNLDSYLRARGAFQVVRNPKEIDFGGQKVRFGPKEIINLNKAYIFELVKKHEMFLQYAGQSEVQGQLKQGRPYCGKTISFSRAIFQFLIDASEFTGEEIHLVPLNISYESVIEDAMFSELIRLKRSGVSQDQIYQADLGHILGEYLNPHRKTRLCMKFGEPEPLRLTGFLRIFGLGKKGLAEKAASSVYQKMMALQSPFPSHVLFTAMGEETKLELSALKERIENTIHLLAARGADMHYLRTESGAYLSSDQVIELTLASFGQQDRKIVAVKNQVFEIRRTDVAVQYVNHITHLLAEPQVK